MSISDDEDSSSDEDIELAAVGAIIASKYYLKYCLKQPCRTSTFTGFHFVSDVLHGHEIRCHESFRMEKHVFHLFCNALSRKYGLKNTKIMKVEEMVGMFLWSVGNGVGNRMVQERFQHSGETVSRHFHAVLKACLRMSIDLIKPDDISFRDIHPKIKNDERYYPFFKDCIGAIDGTHVHCVVPSGEEVKYIGRKSHPTQNIMAACDFNMCFTFAWAGWEGTAHDSRIFNQALRTTNLNFPHPPPGKYYLVDAGYPMPIGYLGPYKKERYHLPVFQCNRRLKNYNGVFNYHHSSLRSTIECTFGVWKKRFAILRDMPAYKFATQVQLIIATMTIHNFIRKNSNTDIEFMELNQDEEQFLEEEDKENYNNAAMGVSFNETSLEMATLRDQIRNEIVEDQFEDF